MKKTAKIMASLAMFMFGMLTAGASADNFPTIEVTATATVNIVPDRITVGISMEEYYIPGASSADSIVVPLSEIERKVRQTLRMAGVSDDMIVVSDIGNYRNRAVSDNFLMAKKLSVVISDFDRIERIYDNLDRRGISGFYITSIDNSEVGKYNRQGLKAALDAAREKAEFIAASEGVTITMPYEIIDTGPAYYETPSFSNVSFVGGAGMENMRTIVRRYSVKVRYLFSAE